MNIRQRKIIPILRAAMVAFLLVLCHAQAKAQNAIMRLSPFARAVRVIKYYEGWHDIRKNYPYIGWGHCIQPYERKRFCRNLTVRQADSLLRADLTSFCALFRKYGKDSLLLAVLAYNVGPYKILGDKKHPKSKLLQKIERGDCNIESDYLDFCRWKGKSIASIRRRRMVEFSLLYDPHNSFSAGNS